jgi:hypothetical protein
VSAVTVPPAVTEPEPARGTHSGMARQWIATPTDRTARELARGCGVSIRTARRWVNSGKVPALYASALEEGDLGRVSPAWRGFRFLRDQLVTPGGEKLRPGEITSIPLRQQQLRLLELAVARLRMGLEPDQGELELG